MTYRNFLLKEIDQKAMEVRLKLWTSEIVVWWNLYLEINSGSSTSYKENNINEN